MTPGQMFDRFTDHTKRALFLARYDAWIVGDTLIDRPHLFRALFAEAYPALKEPLARMNLALETIREAVPPRREGSPTGPMHSAELLFSEEFKEVLFFAVEEADREESLALTPRHLLLGLLRSVGSPEQQTLSRLGLDLDAVRSVGGGGAGPA